MITQNKKGFSLTEVLVATIVMSMIMGSVLAFVQYAGQIWHKGNEKISAQNYNRMAFELIKQELLSAEELLLPKTVGKTSSKIYYKIDGTQYNIYLDSDQNDAERTTLVRIKRGDTNHKMRLARNVALFKAKRLSNKTIEVFLQIRKEQNADDIDEFDASGKPVYEIISSESMVLLAPGIQ